MLVDCPECKKSVSDEAVTCPHCGYQLHGRENLVHCPTCRTDVIPKTNPHDTISKYCPLCNKPITGLAGRAVFLVVFVILFLCGLGFVLATFLRLY